MGKIASLHASKICRNIPLIEDDRYHDHALDSSAYIFRDGRWVVPDRPGWGIELSPEYDYFSKSGQERVIS
jgi:L-alanine-DL-glutamate epimerase-like enolase superfamily enzyme